MDLKRHMGQNHKGVPVNLDCNDCGKRFFYQALPTEDKLKIHRCCEHEKNGKVNQPLEPAHTVYLPMEESEKNDAVAEYEEEELIEID